MGKVQYIQEANLFHLWKIEEFAPCCYVPSRGSDAIKCIACHQKIKISQVVITDQKGDICRQCARDGWELYETGHGVALRQRTPEQRPFDRLRMRQEAAIRQLPLFNEAA